MLRERAEFPDKQQTNLRETPSRWALSSVILKHFYLIDELFFCSCMFVILMMAILRCFFLFSGETAFMELNKDSVDNDYVAEVVPLYGRAVIFSGDFPHSARPPSPSHPGPRYTFAVKLSFTKLEALKKTYSEEVKHDPFSLEESFRYSSFSLTCKDLIGWYTICMSKHDCSRRDGDSYAWLHLTPCLWRNWCPFWFNNAD